MAFRSEFFTVAVIFSNISVLTHRLKELVPLTIKMSYVLQIEPGIQGNEKSCCQFKMVKFATLMNFIER
jgi:hypothetical protein